MAIVHADAVEITNIRYGDGFRRAGIIRCAAKDCSQLIEVLAGSSGNVSPEMICIKAKQKGWHVSINHPSACRCPDHNRKAPKSERIADMPTSQHSASDTVIPIKPPAPTKDLATQVRELAPSLRKKIRDEIDGNFDDTIGAYLGGESDQKIGDRLGVPWAIVAHMREIGWGAVRVDPEIEKLSAELVTACKTLDLTVTALRGIHEDLEAQRETLRQLKAKIAALTQQTR